MLRKFGSFALSLAVCGCAGSDDPRGEGSAASVGSETSDTQEEVDDDASTSTTSDPSSTSTTTSTSTSSSTTDATTTSGSDDSADSSCPVGVQGCPCDEGSCSGELVCVEDMCEAPLQCPADAYEPNDSEETAVYLGEINDNDNNGDSFSAVLSYGDEDWFTYTGDDDAFYIVDPERELVADGDLRLCKFAECLNGLENTEITCPPGTSSATSPAGRPGCCGSSGFKMGVFDCASTTEDSAYIYLRLDQGVQQCVQYTLNYHY